jgi:uncharacterized protein YjbI with pentapeptide repeats
MAGLLTAVAALGALFFTNQSIRGSRDQLHIAEQGQVTDRFGKAIEEVASEQSTVRLGGIYALERLMHDSPADQGTIIEVLSAFVRSSVPTGTVSTGNRSPADHVSPPNDVVSAITVLSRRDRSHDAGAVADLSRTALAFAHLEHLNLSGIDFEDANMESARLSEANLSGADLLGANLNDVDLSGARLDDANLNSASLQNAILFAASMKRAHLSGADLRRARFDQANLTDAIVNLADLRSADLRAALGLTKRQISGELLAPCMDQTTSLPPSLVVARLHEKGRCR